MASVTIAYIGRDTVFSDNLEKEFKEIFEDEVFYYITLYLDLGDYPHTVFPKVLGLKPDLVYIDFSYMPEMMYSVARAILTSRDTREIPVIGILNLVGPEDLKNAGAEFDEDKLEKISFIKAVPTQVQLVHYKGEELRDIASDGLFLANGSIKGRGQYACHKSKGIEAYGNCYSKLTHVTEKNIIIESSIKLDDQQNVMISTDEGGFFDEKKFQVVAKSDANLRNNYRYRYSLKIPLITGKGEENPKVLVNPGPFLKWLKDKESDETSRLKILIIQSGLPVMEQMDKAPNEYPFRFRFVTHLGADLSTIKEFLPHMIVLDFETEETEETEEAETDEEGEKTTSDKGSKSDKDGEEDLPLHAQFNGTSAIREMTSVIKKIVKYDPFIKVFSCSSKTSAFQKVYDYPFILASTQELDFNFVLNMAKMYEQKKKATLLVTSDEFLKKAKSHITLGPLSVSSSIKIGFDAKFTSVSEHEITFLASYQLPIATLVEFVAPIHLYVTIVQPTKELEKTKGKFHHLGIIHGMNEISKGEIRKFVNQLFFIELEEKKKAEQEAYEAKKLEVLKQKEMAESAEGETEEGEENQEGEGKDKSNTKKEDGNE